MSGTFICALLCVSFGIGAILGSSSCNKKWQEEDKKQEEEAKTS